VVLVRRFKLVSFPFWFVADVAALEEYWAEEDYGECDYAEDDFVFFLFHILFPVRKLWVQKSHSDSS